MPEHRPPVAYCDQCVYYTDARCHRYPPPSPKFNARGEAQFPGVNPGDWCGEFERLDLTLEPDETEEAGP